MNAAAKRWVKALRSGKYKQCDGHLANGKGAFCCLGVACELAKEAGVIKDYRRSDGALPVDVRTWLGLKSTAGTMEGKRKYADLTDYNDNAKWTFKKIAALIERQPKGLFLKKARKS